MERRSPCESVLSNAAAVVVAGTYLGSGFVAIGWKGGGKEDPEATGELQRSDSDLIADPSGRI